MNLRIGTILPLIISGLTVIAVASSGLAAYKAFNRRQEAQTFLEVNQVSRMLLRSAGDWAVERGLTNTRLRSPDAASSESLAEIVNARATADQAFRDAEQRLRAFPAMKAAEQSLDEAQAAFQTFESLRARVQDNLARPASGRMPDVVESFMPTITSLIDVAATRLRLTLESLTAPPTSALAQLVGLRHMAAQMAENAGRERGLVGGIIGARSKFTVENRRIAATARGQIELAWQTIAAVRQRPDLSAEMIRAIDGVEKNYFGGYSSLRDAVFAAGDSGEYKVAASDYFTQATAAVRSILRLADAIGNAADQEAAREAADSTSNLIVDGTILLASIVLTLISFWIAFRRIVRPLSGLTGAMEELARGDFAVILPGLGRKDEIGEMAQAVEAFKIKAESKAREEAEAKIRQDQAVMQQRKDDMIRLADAFESAVGEIVETVSSASTELEAAAGALTATAGHAQELTTMVAEASEEACRNVQSVASATEQLNSSVDEISRQVRASARLTSDTVNQARVTNDRVSGLSTAAARIGSVVELISTIAGQTNLLALNATIEAARAGEAGRGFAVVASEVKALAEQTAKATDEISQQISSIQDATGEAVRAIQEISGNIEKLSGTSSVIAAAVEQQGAATQEISRNIQEAAEGTHQVSATISDVRHGASETGSASSQLLAAAQSLSTDSNRLKLEVRKFLETVRAA